MSDTRRQFLSKSACVGVGASILDRLAAVTVSASEEAARNRLNGSTDDDFARLREDYSLAEDVHYLNHASIGTIPKPVQQARQAYLEICEDNPWLYMWGGAWEKSREQVRELAAERLNCLSTEIAITHNTTEFFNVIAHGLPLQSGDEVLFGSLCHVGASEPFAHMSPVRGYSTRKFRFPLNDTANLTSDEIVAVYRSQIQPETQLLVIPHVDNIVGIRHPVAELTRMAKSEGVEFVAVDAAQSVGMLPVDVQELGIDVLATSPHKWLQAPKGLGLTFVAQTVLDVLRPMTVTWGNRQWQSTARKYEDYGTRNLAELLTLGDAIIYQKRITPEQRTTRLRDLWQHARSLTEEAPGTAWRSPSEWNLSASLYAIECKDRIASQLAKTLFQQHGIVVRPFSTNGVETLRVSPNISTTKEELSLLFRAIQA